MATDCSEKYKSNNEQKIKDSDKYLRLKIQLASLVRQFSDGMKLSHIQKNYKNTFGYPVNVAEYNKQNYRELIQQFPELFFIKTNNYFIMTENSESDLPSKELLQVDKCSIPEPYLKKVSVGQYLEVKIHNIYDPSKFWLVIYNKELELFLKVLKSFYDNEMNKFPLSHNAVCINFLCIVSKNNQYFRGVIISAKFIKSNTVRVFLIDTGFIVNVTVDNLFYIHKKFVSVNRFSVRASLAYICPKASPLWNTKALKDFCMLVAKYRLLAKICDIDRYNKVLYVAIRELYPHFSEYINVVLVENNIAKYVFNKENNEKSIENEDEDGLSRLPKNLLVKTDAPYLLPSFYMLESGRVPCSLMELNQIRNVDVQLATLLPNYFKRIERED